MGVVSIGGIDFEMLPGPSPSHVKGWETRRKRKQVCVLCGEHFGEYGNNPDPLADVESGQCCDRCNMTKVIPARCAQLGF
jgi:hypothetical protein